jgi:hypothetical protein
MTKITPSGVVALFAIVLAGCAGGNDRSPVAPGASTTASSSENVPATGNNVGTDSAESGGTAPSSMETDTGTGAGGTTAPSPVFAASMAAAVTLPTPSGLNPSFSGNFLDVNSFPLDLILSGGPPKDGIPALTNPPFAPDASYLSDEDLVLGVVINGVARAYPHNIGWWHEIVNDEIGGEFITVTFCPLTGTGLVFDATDDNGEQFELGVSGLLFNTNLIMYDRRDGTTLYPQMTFTGVQGSRQGDALSLLPVVETTWATWRRLHPDTQVVAEGTYSAGQYGSYPYGNYRSNDGLFLFPLTPSLTSFDGAKEMVLGVRLDGEAKAYPFGKMGTQTIINDQVGGVDIVVLWDRESSLVIPYARQVGDQVLSFEIAADDGFPFLLKDRETKSLWNVNGLALEGPLAGYQRTTACISPGFTFWQDTAVWSP